MVKVLLFFLMGSFLYGHPLIIYTENNPPWNYKDGEELKGVATKIVKLIQKDVKNSSKIELIPWNRAYEETLKKKNHALFITARIKQREDLFYWVGPIITDEVYLYKHKSNSVDINTLEDAKSVDTIDAGPITNAAYMVLKKRGFKNLSTLSRDIGNLNNLKNRRVDLVTLGKYAFRYRVNLENLNYNEFENTGVLLYEYPLYIAFSKKTDKSIVKKWQESFEKLKQNGTIEKVINQKLKEIREK
ncbi:MAG: substrate-binding periplasmic protein [Campylobacterota bacterium]